MRIITGLIFILNFTAWITFDILCWQLTGVTLGLIVLLGLLTFLISWTLSHESIIAPLEYIMQPDLDIFFKIQMGKFGWISVNGNPLSVVFTIRLARFASILGL